MIEGVRICRAMSSAVFLRAMVRPACGDLRVAQVLEDPKLKAQWMSELKEMSAGL